MMIQAPKSSRMHAVSLFSGIGLLDLGLHRAGIETRIFCESDRAARGFLARRFPGIPIHPDVQELTADDLAAAGADPARTVLAGGFPCQDLSVAGSRAGMGAGTRSGLFWHIPRILADFPARWVVLENVPGLLSSHGGRDMGAILGALGDLGYGYAWRVLDAQHFGVPQRRRRVVIVGHLGTPWGAPAEVLLEPESGGGDLATLTGQGSRPAGDAAGRTPAHRVGSALTAHHGRMSADDASSEDDVNLITGFHLTQDPVSGRMAPAIGARSGGNGVAVGSVVRRLTPLECERLQGAPDGWTDGQSDSARYRQLGNAVAVPVFEWVARRLVDVDAQIRGKVGASTRASLRLVHGTAHAGRALEARRK